MALYSDTTSTSVSYPSPTQPPKKAVDDAMEELVNAAARVSTQAVEIQKDYSPVMRTVDAAGAEKQLVNMQTGVPLADQIKQVTFRLKQTSETLDEILQRREVGQ